MSTPKIEPLTPEQRDAMANELPDLRLRAEHGLLKRLALCGEYGPMDVSEAAAGLIALAAGSESPMSAALARAFAAPGSRR